jgi:DNA-directed RNA polymerase sigma subunit (sigma70/sigma32)
LGVQSHDLIALRRDSNDLRKPVLDKILDELREFGISPERARQVELHAFGRLQQAVKAAYAARCAPRNSLPGQ